MFYQFQNLQSSLLYVSYLVDLHLFFYEYYLNPSLSIVLTKVLINLCFSVFRLLINHAYPFQLIFPKWIFYHSTYHLCFQCHPPQFVPILCAHSALVLISQQKSEYLVRLFALLFFPVYSLQALIHTVLPHLKCPPIYLSYPSGVLLCPVSSMKVFFFNSSWFTSNLTL